MSSIVKTDGEQVALRRSARNAKLRTIDYRSIHFMGRSPSSGMIYKDTVPPQASASTPNSSKAGCVDITILEDDSKRNGKTLRSFRNKDTLKHEEEKEVPPLRSNRVRFAVQTKRKQIATRNDASTKRTKKCKENFDTSFEDSSKVVNGEPDNKPNSTPLANQKNSLESASEQSPVCDSFETSNNHAVIETENQVQLEFQMNQSSEINLPNTAIENVSSVSLKKVLFNEVVKSNVVKSPPAKRKMKTRCIKSLYLSQTQDEESSEESKSNNPENTEVQPSQNKKVEQELNFQNAANLKHQLTKENAEIIDEEVMNMSNNNMKEVVSDCVQVTEQKTDNSEEKTTKSELDTTDCTNTKQELNVVHVEKTKQELMEIRVESIEQKQNVISVKSLNQELREDNMENGELELNVSSPKNIELGPNKITIINKEQELKEVTAESVTCEFSINTEENINQELSLDDDKDIEKGAIKSCVANIVQEENQNDIKTIKEIKVSMESTQKRQHENRKTMAELELDECIVKDVQQENSDNRIGNIEEELHGNNDMEQELKQDNVQNMKQEIGDNVIENIEQALNKNGMENVINGKPNSKPNATPLANKKNLLESTSEQFPICDSFETSNNHAVIETENQVKLESQTNQSSESSLPNTASENVSESVSLKRKLLNKVIKSNVVESPPSKRMKKTFCAKSFNLSQTQDKESREKSKSKSENTEVQPSQSKKIKQELNFENAVNLKQQSTKESSEIIDKEVTNMSDKNIKEVISDCMDVIEQKIDKSKEKNTKLMTKLDQALNETTVRDSKKADEDCLRNLLREVINNVSHVVEQELNHSKMENAEQTLSDNVENNVKRKITMARDTESGKMSMRSGKSSEVNKSTAEEKFNRGSAENLGQELDKTIENIMSELVKSSVEGNEPDSNAEHAASIKHKLNDDSVENSEQLNMIKQNDSLIPELQNSNSKKQETKTFEEKPSSYNFVPIEENICRFKRKNHKNRKQVRRLLCDCIWDEDLPEIVGCGSRCLNRLLMIECGSRCRIGNRCSNKRFQRIEYAKTKPFQTDTKGIGLKMAENIREGTFIIEFVGEVLNGPQFRQRVKQYARENTVHHYFMALSSDEVIDATQMGNTSRFINHSCSPNCDTQKWTVNGELRVGFFANRNIKEGEELTFDYKFQIYGRAAQKCFCGAESCKGYIGQVKSIVVDTSGGSKGASRRRKAIEDRRRESFEDLSVEEEIEKLVENGCLRNREDTLLFARLMVRVEDVKMRQQLLDVILKTTEQAFLRMLVGYHALPLIWSWMADGTDLDLRYKILEVLSVLPVPNKTILIKSKLLKEVEKICTVPTNEELDGNSEIAADGDQKRRHTELVDLANELLSRWNLLKQEFRIPKVEEQKKNTNSDMENNAQALDQSTNDATSPKGDDIKSSVEQASILKNKEGNESLFIDVITSSFHSKKNLASKSNRAKYTNLTKKERRQIFASLMAQKYPPKPVPTIDFTRDSTPDSPWTPGTPNAEHSIPSLQDRPVYLTASAFPEPPPSSTIIGPQMPPTNLFPPPSQQIPNLPPPLLFPPPNISVPPPQIPFLGVPPPTLPPAGAVAGPSNIPVPPPSGGWMVDQPPSSSSSAMYHPPPLYPPPTTGIDLTQPPPALPPYHNVPSTATGVPQPFTPFGNSCQNQPFPYPQPPSAAPATGQVTTYHSLDPVPDENGYLTLKIKLPTDWEAAGDEQDNVYFYHIISRKTQWHPPTLADVEQCEDEDVPSPTCEDPQDCIESNERVITVEDESYEEEMVDDDELPPNWKSTRDSDGHLYYYNVITRRTQWEPPSHETSCERDVEEEEEEFEANFEEAFEEEEGGNNTPLLDEPQYPKKKKKVQFQDLPPSEDSTPSQEPTPTLDTTPTQETPSQEADSSNGAKKIKEKFKSKLSTVVIRSLTYYRKPNCTVGRITNLDEFRSLARKLTHYLMDKELRHCKNIEDLHYSEVVRNKARDFIRKYMSKYGSVYKREKAANES